MLIIYLIEYKIIIELVAIYVTEYTIHNGKQSGFGKSVYPTEKPDIEDFFYIRTYHQQQCFASVQTIKQTGNKNLVSDGRGERERGADG